MSLDKSIVLKIANLSRISISDAELPRVLQELTSIVYWMQQLDEVDTDKVDPMTGGTDINNCYLEIHAGAGGTESQDWAQMLIRMYIRWAESQEFKITQIQETYGEEAGIKSTTIKIDWITLLDG